MFMIETKNRRGTVEIIDGVPRLRHRFDAEANVSLRDARAQAIRRNSLQLHQANPRCHGRGPLGDRHRRCAGLARVPLPSCGTLGACG
ncbi:MAG: hypothetical protein ACYC91_14810 [Solirubrobacteraceae bacterium]